MNASADMEKPFLESFVIEINLFQPFGSIQIRFHLIHTFHTVHADCYSDYHPPALLVWMHHL